jgi:hypothetical protein
MEPEQFCRWLEGARELGAFKSGVDEGQKAVILERLRSVGREPGSIESPWWRFVRNLRGLVDLSVDWTNDYNFTLLLCALQSLFVAPRPATRQAGGLAVD